MDLYKEPVKHTCPDIDRLKKNIEEAVSICEQEYYTLDTAIDGFDDVVYNISSIPDELEDLRSANSSLRDWGNALLDKVNELESTVSKMEDDIYELEYQIKNN